MMQRHPHLHFPSPADPPPPHHPPPADPALAHRIATLARAAAAAGPGLVRLVSDQHKVETKKKRVDAASLGPVTRRHPIYPRSHNAPPPPWHRSLSLAE